MVSLRNQCCPEFLWLGDYSWNSPCEGLPFTLPKTVPAKSATLLIPGSVPKNFTAFPSLASMGSSLTVNGGTTFPSTVLASFVVRVNSVAVTGTGFAFAPPPVTKRMVHSDFGWSTSCSAKRQLASGGVFERDRPQVKRVLLIE